MTNFKKFKNMIISLQLFNNLENLYFSQLRDGYEAAYKPQYPKSSNNDIIIRSIDQSGAYLRGNFEVIYFNGNKWTSTYFNNYIEIKNFLQGARK